MPLVGTSHWWGGYENNSERELDVALSGALATDTTLTFDTWYFIEENWDYGFVEVSDDGGATWQTVPVSADGEVISTDTDPQGNNTEGNGLTGVSGGAYGTDSPSTSPRRRRCRPARRTSGSATRRTRATWTPGGS